MSKEIENKVEEVVSVETPVEAEVSVETKAETTTPTSNEEVEALRKELASKEAELEKVNNTKEIILGEKRELKKENDVLKNENYKAEQALEEVRALKAEKEKDDFINSYKAKYGDQVEKALELKSKGLNPDDYLTITPVVEEVVEEPVVKPTGNVVKGEVKKQTEKPQTKNPLGAFVSK